jgi:NTP pyrophosphatase (non-canonical NTP hydrolase)
MSQSAPLSELQARVDAWAARYWGGDYWPPLANLARLTEELGEVARVINQTHGPKRVKATDVQAEAGGELADALFALLCLANSLEIDLQAAWEATLEKYRVRDEEGTGNSGLGSE